MDVCTCNMYWNLRVAACTEGRRHTAACDGYVIVCLGWQLEQKAKLDEIAERQREREKEIEAKVRFRLVFCCRMLLEDCAGRALDSWNMCVSVFVSLAVCAVLDSNRFTTD